MHSEAFSTFVTLAALFVLCLPPLYAVRLLLRRQKIARYEHRKLYRWALIATIFALAFNLAVALLVPPNFNVGLNGNNFYPVHIIAMGFSWISFWGCIALMTLFRHRRSTTLDTV